MEQSRAQSLEPHAVQGVSLAQVISLAREGVAAISGLPIDAVSKCERDEDGGWRLVVDVCESAARMGENDLLAVYEVTVDADGTILAFDRLGRYRREDGGLS